MATQFFNTFRSSSNLKTTGNSLLSKTLTVGVGASTKREKLKNLIIQNLTKKYGFKELLPVIVDEVDTFIHCNNLSDRDLKNLDKRIQHLIEEKGLGSKKLSRSVDNQNRKISTAPVNQLTGKGLLETETNSQPDPVVQSNNMNITKMSQHSNLSEIFRTGNTLNKNDPYVPEEELIKPKKVPHQFEFEHEEDLWNAFNNVNRRLYEQEKIEEKRKDKEIKRRTKEDLDNQIKHKLIRLEDERMKNSEYHGILIKHIDHLNKLEEEKQNKIKQKILKEKENRDKQMWDQNYKKKVEKIKQRKYENQLLEYINGEIQNEKDNIVTKKVEAKQALKKTLEENERNRLEKEKMIEMEHEEDMKSMEEYNKILEKQENDRVQYFKNIEMKSTDFMAKMTDTVLKDLKDKNSEADRRMNEYLKKKEEREKEEELRKLIKIKSDKKEMKKFLDMQVQEKKKLNEFEKDLDQEQATIIKKDYELYEDYKRDVNEKVSLFITHLGKAYEFEQLQILKGAN